MSHIASKKENPSFLETLVGFKADIETEDDEGWRPLHIAARYGDIETLILLESAALGYIDTDERNNHGFTAMSDVEWRKDENEQWADLSLQPRDEDPAKWYAAFETLVDSIRKDQCKSSNEDECDDGGARGGLFDNESPGWIEINEGDDHEVWKDALESADRSSDLDTPN